jgi:hypothetical protein
VRHESARLFLATTRARSAGLAGEGQVTTGVEEGLLEVGDDAHQALRIAGTGHAERRIMVAGHRRRRRRRHNRKSVDERGIGEQRWRWVRTVY